MPSNDETNQAEPDEPHLPLDDGDGEAQAAE